MKNLYTLMGEIVTTYQDVHDIVVCMLNDPSAINYFCADRPESPSYSDTLDKLSWPGILVSHVSTVMGIRGGMTQWRHLFRVDFKLTNDGGISYFDLMQLFVDGIPSSSDGLSLLQCSFDNDLDSMEDIIFVPLTDKEGKVFYRLEFALQERGGAG